MTAGTTVTFSGPEENPGTIKFCKIPDSMKIKQDWYTPSNKALVSLLLLNGFQKNKGKIVICTKAMTAIQDQQNTYHNNLWFVQANPKSNTVSYANVWK